MDTETLAAMANDTEYQEQKINKVIPDVTPQGFQGWTVCCQDGGCLFIPGNDDIAPTPGEVMRTYGRGFGYPVRGIVIGGRVYKYQTDAQMHAEFKAAQASGNAKKKAAFDADRTTFDAKVAALPPAFRERMEGFLATSPDWGWKLGGYELFVCTEAVKILDVIPMADGIKSFHAASMDDQKALVPTLEYNQHSGNTFGMAVSLAHIACTNVELVPKMHAAMCALVGCEDAGCWGQRASTKAEREAQALNQS